VGGGGYVSDLCAIDGGGGESGGGFGLGGGIRVFVPDGKGASGWTLDVESRVAGTR